jgi:hypothetical protein
MNLLKFVLLTPIKLPSALENERKCSAEIGKIYTSYIICTSEANRRFIPNLNKEETLS